MFLLGEGFDDARLDTLFLTLPISWRGTLTQYAGRLHRNHDMKKKVTIYDYADLKIPMLQRMLDRRRRGYKAIGYEITESQLAVDVVGVFAQEESMGSWSLVRELRGHETLL